ALRSRLRAVPPRTASNPARPWSARSRPRPAVPRARAGRRPRPSTPPAGSPGSARAAGEAERETAPPARAAGAGRSRGLLRSCRWKLTVGLWLPDGPIAARLWQPPPAREEPHRFAALAGLSAPRRELRRGARPLHPPRGDALLLPLGRAQQGRAGDGRARAQLQAPAPADEHHAAAGARERGGRAPPGRAPPPRGRR